jgi:hypothetical protein
MHGTKSLKSGDSLHLADSGVKFSESWTKNHHLEITYFFGRSLLE